MMVSVQIKPEQIARIRRMFQSYPKAVPRIMKESINRTSTKTRTKAVAVIHDLLGGKIAKKDIRKKMSFQRATNTRWEARLRLYGTRIPLVSLLKKSALKKGETFVTSPKQSLYLYKHVFKKLYGDAAIFSERYKIHREFRSDLTITDIDGSTKSLSQLGWFIARMRSGHVGVFARTNTHGGLEEQYTGSSVTSVLEQSPRMKEIEEHAYDNLGRDIDSRVKRYLDMAGKGALS